MTDISALKQALDFSPDNVPLRLLLAKAYVDAFQLDEAEQAYEEALRLEPANAAAQLGVANVAAMSGKTSEAALRAEAVCESVPDLGAAWILRAKIALQEGDAASARAFYDTGVRADPSQSDSDLLKRIETEGGTAAAVSQTSMNSGGYAGAQMDPESTDADQWQESQPESSEPDDLGLDLAERPDVDFSKVGGMDGVKEDIRMKILYPMENKDLFAAYGKKAGGGVLMYGPPGCGKTLISRATAGEIDATFISIGLHQILDMWIGGSEKRLHEIFEFARANAPAVLFFDEVDALASDRRDMRGSAGRTVINQFLAEMDGEIGENDGVLILGATNAPWHLDSAFLRPGRFDRIIFVPPPDLGAKRAIIEIMADGKPVAALDAESLAGKMKDFSGADIKSVFDQAIEDALTVAMKKGKIEPVTMRDLTKAAKRTKPSCRKWFESAKNHALYANQSGLYDEVLDYLGIKK